MPYVGEKLNMVDTAADFFAAYLDTTTSPAASEAALSLTKQAANSGNMPLSTGGAGTEVTADGLYLVTYQFRTDRDVSTADPLVIFRLNAGGTPGAGSVIRYIFANVSSSNSGNYTTSGSFVTYLDEGDEIEAFTSSGATATNFLVAGATFSTIEVTRMPGTAMIS